MLATVLTVIGVVTLIFSILYAFAANLQYTKFEYLLPSYIGIIISGIILFLSDWFRVNRPQKKISIFALLCFLSGFFNFIIMSGGIKNKMNGYSGIILILLTCISSIVFGIFFKKNNKNADGVLVGSAISIVGIIFSTICILLILIAILASMK